MLALIGLALGGSGMAGAQEETNQGDSAAVAVNTKDGSSVFRLAFSVKRVMGSNLDADNAAVAYASCDECKTVAVSIQVVLAMGDVDSVTTDNLAMSLNYDCTECETLAAAFQYVFGNGEPVRFTAEGNRKLADIRRRFYQLRTRQDLTLEQLAAEVKILADEVAKVVEEEVVPTGQAGAPGQTTTTTPGATTTSSPAPASTTTTVEGGTTSTTEAQETSTTTSTSSGPTSTTAGAGASG